MQITHGMEDPRIGEMPWLELIVKEMKMEQTTLPTKAWFLITLGIFQKVQQQCKGRDTECDIIGSHVSLFLWLFESQRGSGTIRQGF